MLSYFTDFSNPFQPLRIIKTLSSPFAPFHHPNPVVVLKAKSNYLFSINYTAHFDTKKKKEKKNLANQLQIKVDQFARCRQLGPIYDYRVESR